MPPKQISLKDAVAENVRDGDTVFVGGFGQCVPFAIAHEIARQRKKNLTLCRSGADILFDLLIGAGCVGKVSCGYVGNPGIGLAHAFRRAVEKHEIEVEDWTNFAMVLRLHAGALGVPFLPTATLYPGDLADQVDIRTVTCPFTGEELSAVPALNPDVAIIHAHCADEDGNVQLFGLPGDTLEGANASRRIICTVEEIVSREEVRKRPDRTIVPGFRVASVSEVPFGAHPSYVDGFYGRDDDAYAEWDKLSRKTEPLAAWIEKNVRGAGDFAGYLKNLDPGRLDALKAARRDINAG
jgi:glutaconate CoA-transferase subunit A